MHGSSGPRPLQSLGDARLAQLGFVSKRERDALLRLSVPTRTFEAGEELVRQGSSPKYLYALSEGWAYRSITTRNGARQIPTVIIAGAICNLDNFLFERADFAVHALTKVTVLMLPRELALLLAEQYPGVGRAFTWLALTENAILSQWAVGLGQRSAQGRLAHLLLELSTRLEISAGREESFDLPLTQELLGDVLGLTSVHVNRTMRQLRDAGLIATSGPGLTILDHVGLQAVAEFDPSYLRQIEASAA